MSYFISDKVTLAKSIVLVFVLVLSAGYLCDVSHPTCHIFLLCQALIALSGLKSSTEGPSSLKIMRLLERFCLSLFHRSVFILFMFEKIRSTFTFVNGVTSRISKMCNTFLHSSKMVLLAKIFHIYSNKLF